MRDFVERVDPENKPIFVNKEEAEELDFPAIVGDIFEWDCILTGLATFEVIEITTTGTWVRFISWVDPYFRRE